MIPHSILNCHVVPSKQTAYIIGFDLLSPLTPDIDSSCASNVPWEVLGPSNCNRNIARVTSTSLLYALAIDDLSRPEKAFATNDPNGVGLLWEPAKTVSLLVVYKLFGSFPGKLVLSLEFWYEGDFIFYLEKTMGCERGIKFVLMTFHFRTKYL